MKNILIDAGPLIALFSPGDKYHKSAVEFLAKSNEHLVTTWPVLTETCHMLRHDVRTQIAFLTWLERGAIEIYPLLKTDLQRIISLTEKYSDLPMDLADASLVVVSERTGIKEIITIDNDFTIYRTLRKERFKAIVLKK